MSAEAMEPGDCSTRVPFLHPSNFVRIQAEQTENNQNSVTLNGVILQNSLPGILYHSVGINGAHYSDYNSSPQFFRQMKMLKPDLVIISMGTNEGANTKVTMDEIIAQVTTTVQSIRAVNPATCILITTPTDDYLKKKYKNPYLEAVQRAIVQSASQQGVACWDLYNITGGFGSCAEWRKAALMQRDGVHFTKTGYLVQGDLLFKALIYGYQKYAAY
jgi:lysophospholipase L1-like esterase